MILSVLATCHLLRYSPHLEIWTFNIFLGDMLSVMFTAAAILRLTMNKQLQIVANSYHWRLFVIFSVLAIIGILRGLPNYGQTTIVHAREHIYVIATTAYFCTFQFDKFKIKNIFPIFIAFGMIILGVVFLRWLDVLPRPDIMVQRGIPSFGARIGSRGAAFYLSFTLFTLLTLKINKLTSRHILFWVMIASLIVAVILSQIRALWVATFVGLLILALKYQSKFVGGALGIACLLLVIISFLWFYQSDAIAHLVDNLHRSASVFWRPEHTTFSWRIASCKAYLKQMSLKDYIFGVPFGTRISYEVEGVQWTASVHNMFVDQIHRTGVLGLIAFTLLQFFLILRMNRFAKIEKDEIIRSMLNILWITLVCYQVFFLAWTADILYPIILGISISMVIHREYNKKNKVIDAAREPSL